MASAASVSAHLSSDPSSQQRWICIYPAYINSKRTTKEGRRIAKEKAVENPTVEEIRDVCISQGLSVTIEGEKRYPRELSLEAHVGRVRVQLKKSDGTPVKPTFANRKQLFEFIALTIPRLKSRQAKSSGASADASGSAQGGGGNKGKSKKKRK